MLIIILIGAFCSYPGLKGSGSSYWKIQDNRHLQDYCKYKHVLYRFSFQKHCFIDWICILIQIRGLLEPGLPSLKSGREPISFYPYM